MPFWTDTALEDMTPEQWESLCDGCGRCCLLKLEDEDDGSTWTTAIACRLLDGETCRCSEYEHRFQRVPGCLQMTIRTARELTWLPETCAYRRVARGEPLAWWHPLVSGDPRTVHDAGISVRGWTVSEDDVTDDDLADWLLTHEPA